MSLCTEEEAKERWCPFSRYSSAASNRWHVQARRNPDTNEKFEGFTEPNPVQCRCIASQCMAWRWGQEPRSGKPTIEELEKILQGPEPHVEILPSGELVSTTRGYCGLAGKP